jgi:tetratricopeptide (TPR) repeat protein
MAEQSGEPEPPITRVLKSTILGGGPVTAAVRQQENMRTQAYIIVFVVATVGCNNVSTTTAPASSRVVFRSEDGRELTADDLANATGELEYEIVSDDQIPAEANTLHQKARQLGAAGDYEAAIEALDQAQTLAPDWPYPTYDKAFTYLLMKNFAKARDNYRKTVELSPRGFFTAITALDALELEENGDLPEGTYAAYMSLEWISDPAQRAGIVSQMVEKFPTFAPLWKEFSLQCEDTAEKLAAIERGLAAKPDRETKGILLINKALALHEQGDAQAATSILGELALDPDTTFANEHLAKQSLAMINQ